MDQFFKKILNNFLENIPLWLRVALAFVIVILISLSSFPPSSYPEFFPEKIVLIITWAHPIFFILFFLLFIAGIIIWWLRSQVLLKKPSVKFRRKNTENYARVGERHFDIQIDKEIDQDLKFSFEILLAKKKQDAVLYFEFEASNSRKYWIGFSLNKGNPDMPYKRENERTYHYSSNDSETFSKEEINVYSIILERFEEFTNSGIIPTKITTIRLRGSDVVREPVNFYYYFSES